MTNGDSMSENRDCGADAAAYALDALEPAEAEAFRHHMESCIVCRDEVAAFTQVTGSLPLAASQLSAPRGLKRRVMRAVRAQPRSDHAVGKRSAPPTRPILAGGLALAIAAAAVVGGIELASNEGSTRVINASVIGSPGTASLRVTNGRAELIVNHMPAPPSGLIYEVWLKRGNHPPQPTSALFSVTTTGAGDVEVPGDLQGVSSVLVTPELAHGSLVPTHAPVIVAHLA
jgi:hypothetical protein